MPGASWKSHFIFFILLFLHWSCQQKLEKNAETPTISTAEDVFADKANIRYAKHFTVSYHGNYKVVRTSATLGDWDAASSERMDIEDIMVLVQRGTIPPELTGELSNASVVIIPTNRIATNNAASEIWIDMLNLSRQQVAVGGLKTYDDSTRYAVQTGKLGQIGYFWADPPDMEVLLHRQPDILLSTISRIDFNQALEKIRRLGIATAPIFDWAEEDYLGRAEWIKYISLFFNREATANALFEEIEGRINQLKKMVASTDTSPSCIWGHYVDGGFWLANANNAEARLLKDAGLINPAEDFTLPFSPVGEAFTSEEWLLLGQQVEHWIISEGTTLVRLPSQNYLEGFQAWREEKLYHHYRRSKPEHDVYDWYNMSIVRPDWVLADLIALFHPDLLPGHNLIFFGHFAKNRSNG